jgi:hypothetical protein
LYDHVVHTKAELPITEVCESHYWNSFWHEIVSATSKTILLFRGDIFTNTSCFANHSAPLQRNRGYTSRLCEKHRKKIVWLSYLTNIMAGTKRFFNISYTIYTVHPRFICSGALYGLRNTTSLYSKDVALGKYGQ